MVLPGTNPPPPSPAYAPETIVTYESKVNVFLKDKPPSNCRAKVKCKIMLPDTQYEQSQCQGSLDTSFVFQIFLGLKYKY